MEDTDTVGKFNPFNNSRQNKICPIKNWAVNWLLLNSLRCVTWSEPRPSKVTADYCLREDTVLLHELGRPPPYASPCPPDGPYTTGDTWAFPPAESDRRTSQNNRVRWGPASGGRRGCRGVSLGTPQRGELQPRLRYACAWGHERDAILVGTRNRIRGTE